MIAIREIINVIDGKISYTLPAYLTATQVEIIVIPIMKSEKKAINYSLYFGVSNLNIEKIDSYINSARDEWGTEIFN